MAKTKSIGKITQIIGAVVDVQFDENLPEILNSIVTENNEKVAIFFDRVDSSSVMHNLPTCWADGFEYGLGAEVGISTDKIHARGPVGLEGLTSQKFIVKGNSQLRGS